MDLSHSTLVVVPTYNEAENISPILYTLTREVPDVDVLVVDDNSPDGTAQLVSQFIKHTPRVHLLNRPKKDGLAGAYIEGFGWGLDQGYQAFISMDADFSHQPTDVARIVEELKKSDVVVGCRYIPGGEISGWGPTRQFISRGGNFYAKTILRTPFNDLTGGFNGWNRRVLEKIDVRSIRSKGYAFQVEMKYRAYKANFQITEIPIRFANREVGTSKMSGTIFWEAAFRVLEMRRSHG